MHTATQINLKNMVQREYSKHGMAYMTQDHLCKLEMLMQNQKYMFYKKERKKRMAFPVNSMKGWWRGDEL